MLSGMAAEWNVHQRTDVSCKGFNLILHVFYNEYEFKQIMHYLLQTIRSHFRVGKGGKGVVICKVCMPCVVTCLLWLSSSWF